MSEKVIPALIYRFKLFNAKTVIIFSANAHVPPIFETSSFPPKIHLAQSIKKQVLILGAVTKKSYL